MTTYSWTFSTLCAYVEKAGESDVVYRVDWVFSGVDEAGYSARAAGNSMCDYEAGDPFIPLSDLEQSDVQGWVTTSLGADEIAALTASIDTQIAVLANPTEKVVRVMPWSSDAAEGDIAL